MTKKLESVFNLPTMKDNKKEIFKKEMDPEEVQELVQRVDKIDAALPRVKGLEEEDEIYNDYSERAIEAFEELLDLGKNVADSHAADVFQAAAAMFGHAITARTNKVKKKVDMIRLQIRKGELDFDHEKLEYLKKKNLPPSNEDDVIESQGRVVATRDEIVRAAMKEIQKENAINGNTE